MKGELKIMNAKQMLNALPTIKKIMNLDLPFKTSYAFFGLAKKITEQQEFFINKEKEMITKYDAKIQESGEIQFRDVQAQANFVKEHDELMNCDIEGIAAIQININDLANIKLTPLEIGTLEGFIEICGDLAQGS